MSSDDRDEEFAQSIASDVLKCLNRDKFIERLDDVLCPSNSREALVCAHSWEISSSILRELKYDDEAIADVITVLRHEGACCDCEVLYNIAQESRLKARYWKAKHLEIMERDRDTDN